MIKNSAILKEFEQNSIASRKADPEENLRIFEDLYHFAVQIGRFTRTNPLEGLETKIALSRILRRVKRTP